MASPTHPAPDGAICSLVGNKRPRSATEASTHLARFVPYAGTACDWRQCDTLEDASKETCICFESLLRTHDDLSTIKRLPMVVDRVAASSLSRLVMLMERGVDVVASRLTWEHPDDACEFYGGQPIPNTQRTPLMVAAYYAQFETVSWLLRRGASIEAVDRMGHTVLDYILWVVADSKGFPAPPSSLQRKTTALLLLHAGGTIRPRAVSRVIAMHELDFIRFVVERGGTLDYVYEGRTPLHFACRRDDALPIVSYLVDHGACVDTATATQRKETPLMFAAKYGNVDVARYLLNRGARLHARDIDGRSVLCYAVHGTSYSMVYFLLSRGASVHPAPALAPPDSIPLIAAIQRGADVNLVRLLLHAGADLHIRDESGRTPLHHACYRRNMVLIQTLMAAGSDVHALDHQGVTVLMSYLKRVHVYGSFPSFLLRAGVSIQTHDVRGRDVISYMTEDMQGNVQTFERVVVTRRREVTQTLIEVLDSVVGADVAKIVAAFVLC